MIEALQQVLRNLGFQVDGVTLLAVFFLALARVGLAVSIAPFFGGQGLLSPVKIGLSAMLTAMLLPSIAPGTASRDLSSVLFLSLLAKEAMIGLTIGFVAQLVFYAVQTAGALVDTARGMDQPALHAPQLPGNASALAQFKLQAALVLFLTLNGHLIFIQALGRSFEQLPLLGFPRMGSGATGLAEQATRVSAEVFVVALQLAAPMLIALFVVDACFGVLAKVAPQVNVFMESLPVKSFVGLVVLAVAIGFIFVRMEAHFSRFFWRLYVVIGGLA